MLGLMHEIHSHVDDVHSMMNASHRVSGAQPTTSPNAGPVRGRGRRFRIQWGRGQGALHGEIYLSAGFIRRGSGCRSH